jgi:hypothetical protein
MQDHDRRHPTMIPDWLQRHLVDIGRWDADGVHRAVSSTTCRRCGARILVALDDDICAIAVQTDPGPINAAGELQALLTGRKTYRLRHTYRRWELDRRTPMDIAAERPEHIHVLVSHQCGNAISGNGPAILNPRPTASVEESCPF